MDHSPDRSGSGYADYPDELPVIVRGSEVLNLTVMDRGTMQGVGRVERLWMYPQAHRILGLICKDGSLLGKKRWAYKLPQIESLNSSNLWVGGAGTATSPEQIRQLETLIDHEIWVDGGDRLGVIVDCLFNRKTGQITQYLFVNNRLRQLIDASNPLRPEEILSFGNQRVLVSPQALVRLRRERPNLRDTFSQMKEQARGEYEQVTNQTQERVRSWGEEAKTAKERLAEQAALLKQQAAERAKLLQEQASQEILPQISEQAQGLSQKMGQQYHAVQRRAQDFIEELPPLEQLSEEMRGYGRTHNSDRDDGSQRGAASDYESSDGADYEHRYGDDGRYGNGGEASDRTPSIQSNSLEHDVDSETEADYRQSRRRRYRRDQRSGGRSGDLPQEFELDRTREPSYGSEQSYGSAPPYGYEQSSVPLESSPGLERGEPRELTWVDEDLPPAHPSPTRFDSTEPIGDDPREERVTDSQRDPALKPPSSTPPSSFSSSPVPAASRDNPWGYADGAIQSDWDDLEFASETSSGAVKRNQESEAAEMSISAPSEAEHAENAQDTDNAQEFAPLGLENSIAPEDLEDDDPWI